MANATMPSSTKLNGPSLLCLPDEPLVHIVRITVDDEILFGIPVTCPRAIVSLSETCRRLYGLCQAVLKERNLEVRDLALEEKRSSCKNCNHRINSAFLMSLASPSHPRIDQVSFPDTCSHLQRSGVKCLVEYFPNVKRLFWDDGKSEESERSPSSRVSALAPVLPQLKRLNLLWASDISASLISALRTEVPRLKTLMLDISLDLIPRLADLLRREIHPLTEVGVDLVDSGEPLCEKGNDKTFECYSPEIENDSLQAERLRITAVSKIAAYLVSPKRNSPPSCIFISSKPRHCRRIIPSARSCALCLRDPNRAKNLVQHYERLNQLSFVEAEEASSGTMVTATRDLLCFGFFKKWSSANATLISMGPPPLPLILGQGQSVWQVPTESDDSEVPGNVYTLAGTATDFCDSDRHICWASSERMRLFDFPCNFAGMGEDDVEHALEQVQAAGENLKVVRVLVDKAVPREILVKAVPMPFALSILQSATQLRYLDLSIDYLENLKQHQQDDDDDALGKLLTMAANIVGLHVNGVVPLRQHSPRTFFKVLPYLLASVVRCCRKLQWLAVHKRYFDDVIIRPSHAKQLASARNSVNEFLEMSSADGSSVLGLLETWLEQSR